LVYTTHRTIRQYINCYHYVKPSVFNFYELLSSYDKPICISLHVEQKKLYQLETTLDFITVH